MPGEQACSFSKIPLCPIVISPGQPARPTTWRTKNENPQASQEDPNQGRNNNSSRRTFSVGTGNFTSFSPKSSRMQIIQLRSNNLLIRQRQRRHKLELIQPKLGLFEQWLPTKQWWKFIRFIRVVDTKPKRQPKLQQLGQHLAISQKNSQVQKS